MMAKIICPYHEDTQPSMHVYETHSHCFVCGVHVPNDKIGVKIEIPKKQPENVQERLEYIRNLPLARVRCLDLHQDSSGFYIVWPSGDYYKRRNTFDKKARYQGPGGVRAPLLAYPGSKDHLIIIEGEMNCLSVYHYCNVNDTLVSPGAASEMMRHLKSYEGYKRITIVVDHDAAGIGNGIMLKEALLKSGNRVSLVTRETDYNNVLTQSGASALRAAFKKDIE